MTPKAYDDKRFLLYSPVAFGKNLVKQRCASWLMMGGLYMSGVAPPEYQWEEMYLAERVVKKI